MGAFIGTVISAITSERYGRKWTLIVAWFISTGGTVIIASSISIEMVMVGMFFAGMGVYPASTVIYIILSE